MIGIYLAGTAPNHNDNVVKYFVRHVPEFLGRDCVYLDKYAIHKVERHCGCDVIKFDGHKFVNATKSWRELSEYTKDFLKTFDIDTLVFFKIFYLASLCNEKDGLARHFFKGGDDQYAMKYVTAMTSCESLSFIQAASEVCDNVYQYLIDPNEIDVSNYLQFRNFDLLYYLRGKRYSFAPYWCYGLLNDENVFVEDKVKDFSFRCSAFGESRQWLVDVKPEVQKRCSLDVNIISTKEERHRSFISQEAYFAELRGTRFTTVVKPYNYDTFSWMRFMEAIYCGCLPLVFSDCCLDEIDELFHDISDIIKSELLVKDFFDAERVVKSMSEKKRRMLVRDIVNCESLEQVTDLDMIRSEWQSFRGLGESR